MLKVVLSGTVVGLLTAGPVLAAGEKHIEVNAPGVHVTVDTGQKRPAERPFQLARASMIIGENVENAQGDHLGNIEELAIDVNHKRIAYAVVDLGAFLGVGNRYFAIPFPAMDYRPDQQKLVLGVEKGRLQEAKGFDRAQWPDMADQRWNRDTYTFYGQQPYWERGGSRGLQGEPISQERKVIKKHRRHETVIETPTVRPQNLLKTNADLFGHPVRHASNGEVIGELNDILVDRYTGDVAFIVLKLDRHSSAVQGDPRRDYVALPAAMFLFDRHGDPNAPYTVECCFIKLREHRYSAEKAPNLSSRNWARDLYDDFGRTPYWEER